MVSPSKMGSLLKRKFLILFGIKWNYIALLQCHQIQSFIAFKQMQYVQI